MLGLKGVEAGDAAWIAAKERRVSAIAADLDGRIATGDFVQVLDTTEAGIHALLRLHAVQPTRFIYDFHFFTTPRADGPSVCARNSWRASTRTRRSSSCCSSAAGLAGGYERVEEFPGLRHRLSAYQVDRRRDGYIVYAR